MDHARLPHSVIAIWAAYLYCTAQCFQCILRHDCLVGTRSQDPEDTLVTKRAELYSSYYATLYTQDQSSSLLSCNRLLWHLPAKASPWPPTPRPLPATKTQIGNPPCAQRSCHILTPTSSCTLTPAVLALWANKNCHSIAPRFHHQSSIGEVIVQAPRAAPKTETRWNRQELSSASNAAKKHIDHLSVQTWDRLATSPALHNSNKGHTDGCQSNQGLNPRDPSMEKVPLHRQLTLESLDRGVWNIASAPSFEPPCSSGRRGKLRYQRPAEHTLAPKRPPKKYPAVDENSLWLVRYNVTC